MSFPSENKPEGADPVTSAEDSALTASEGLRNSGPAATPPDGFPFDKHSSIRRLTEPATFAFYPYIAGLTVMNDRIAAGVEAHSSFMEHPWGRLFGTVDAAITLLFGNERESLAMAHRLWRFHETTVQGGQGETRYDANDGSLQAWVLLAVFKGLEETNRRWVKPLATDERASLYQDIKTFGKMFGTPERALPVDIDGLDERWESMLDGDELLRTDSSRRMARAVFRFRSHKVPEPLARLGQAVSVTSLDRRLQDKSGLHPTTLNNRLATAIDTTMRHTYGRLPHQLREQAIPSYLTIRRHLAPVMGSVLRLAERSR